MKPFQRIYLALFIATIAFFCPTKSLLAVSSSSVTVTVNVMESISISPANNGLLEVRNNTSNGCLILIDDNAALQEPLSSDEFAINPDVRRITVVSNI